MCIRLEIVQLITMDEYTRNNWAKVRKALKEAGKTDSFLYRQSVSVTEGRGLLDKEPSLIDADAIAKELMNEKDG